MLASFGQKSLSKISHTKIFIAELIGTFLLVVFATGSIVLVAQINGTPGYVYAAIAPFIALVIGVYSFRKISFAHLILQLQLVITSRDTFQNFKLRIILQQNLLVHY